VPGTVNDRPRRPPALDWSVRLGALGAVLLVAGLLTDVEWLILAAVAAGAASLVSALVWRSQLIDAWHRQRRDGPPPADGEKRNP